MGRSVPDTTDSLTLLGKRVLVVEDEPFIAFDIADTIEKEGGHVVGPAMSIRAALHILSQEEVDGAILDVNLPDGDIGPVIAALQVRGIFCVIHTGAGLTPELQDMYPHLRVFLKPTPPSLLAHAVAEKLAAPST